MAWTPKEGQGAPKTSLSPRRRSEVPKAGQGPPEAGQGVPEGDKTAPRSRSTPLWLNPGFITFISIVTIYSFLGYFEHSFTARFL